MDATIVELLRDKIDKVEEKVDKIDEKLDQILEFKWQIVGGSVVMSVRIGVLIQVANLVWNK